MAKARRKTARQLGLTQKELNALVWTRTMLSKRRFRHLPGGENGNGVGNKFNMGYLCGILHKADDEAHTCGTVACIGGWMALHLLGLKANARGVYKLTPTQEHAVSNRMEEVDLNCPKIHGLFYPASGGYPPRCGYGEITEKEAVDAIDTFLTTGQADWGVRYRHGN